MTNRSIILNGIICWPICASLSAVALLLVNRLKTNIFFVNMPLKLLSPEAFAAQNALNIVWRPGSAGTCWGNLQRFPRPPAEFEGSTSKGKGKDERERRGQKGWEMAERVGKGEICVIDLRGMDDPDCRR